jgi:hypothetical protein
MDTQTHSQRKTLLSLKRVRNNHNSSLKKAERAAPAQIEWEMSALDALEVNYLTRFNKSINTH